MHPLYLVIFFVLVPATCAKPGRLSARPLLDAFPFVEPIETTFTNAGLNV